MKTTFKIYWWAMTDKGKKRGIDTVVVDKEDFDERDAEALIEYFSNANSPDKEHPDMKNFNAYYPLATHCLDYGFVKLVKVKQGKQKQSKVFENV